MTDRMSEGAVRGLESVRRAQARALDPQAVEGPFPVDTRPIWERALDRATAKAFSGVSFQAAIDEHVREQVRAEEARLVEVDDWARWWHHAREAERRRPMLGSEERPYELVVPRWVESRAEAQGDTCQAIADRLFRVKVHVVVVD